MIIYKDVIGQLEGAGYSTYRIRKEKLLSESTLMRLRKNEPISLKNAEIICQLLHCQLNDIMYVVYDDNIDEKP